MARIEAVIFDWAGTTVDFGSLSPVGAFMEAFRRAGVEVTEEETRKPMGMLKIDHIRTMLAMDRIRAAWIEKHGAAPTDADAQRIYDDFEPALMSVLDERSKLKPHVLECVAALRERGLSVGSTTGYTSLMMDVVRPAAARQGYAPDTCVTADDTGGFGRPWPFMIFENMRLLKVSAVSAVVKVGDTVSDIREANAAGVVAVGVTDGSSVAGCSEAEWNALSEDDKNVVREKAKKVFLDAGADYVIRDLSELPGLVDRIEAE